MILQKNKILKIFCGASEKDKFISMQKKPEKIKHKNVILQFYGAKNNLKNYFTKIQFQKFAARKKKKSTQKKHQRR